MSKITFRADDDLINAIEGLDASKSEVMRDALRAYLGLDLRQSLPVHSPPGDAPKAGEIGLHRTRSHEFTGTIEGIDLTVRVTPSSDLDRPGPAPQPDADDHEEVPCSECGELVDVGYVHCPTCGHPRGRRVLCECGRDLESAWSFCPDCGRRTPSVDVLDRT